ncbi:MAG: RagB/SusD family nutrient uptake outer membrane protein [Chitinophagaceae bacterium]|nr:MAG: RagB/SusD family nutrient uptake outer membrane protein [Chitinophagaceae bacterium]
MKKNLKYYISLASLVLAVSVQSCTEKLDLSPENTTTSDVVFSTMEGYRSSLAKLYISLATEGNIPSQIVKDGGNTGLLRQFWNLQCITTDEAGWNFTGDTDPIGLHQFTWNASTQAVSGAYYKSYYIITICNNYLQESTDAKLSARGFSETEKATIKNYRAEARFLRAYCYWILMDLFGNVPFADESIVVGSGVLPTQIRQADLFNWLVTELGALQTDMVAAKTNEYGRADKAAAQALLARIYLNAEVYAGTAKYTEAIAAAKSVIDAGYTLHPKYKELMLGDNHQNTSENIWTLQFDGLKTQSYSGTTFLVHAPAGVPGDSSGSNGSWNCMRMTEQFVDKFNSLDLRGQFWTNGQQKNMDQLLNAATNGYSSTKFRNKNKAGGLAPNYDATFASIDFPVFRTGEMYLIYAEAVVRGGTGGSGETALNYLKALAQRARPTDPNAASVPQMTLPYIIDERARELFWEGFRRTDLRRFGQFTTGAYLWAWKGNVRNGRAMDDHYNLFPIPSTDIASNPNIRQNTGY